MVLNAVVVVFFLAAMGAAVYVLTTGETEKRIGRNRMLSQLKEEQAASTEGPAGYRVTPLADADYAARLLDDLSRARESVDVLMFEIKLGKTADNPANRLVAALIAARERAVRVRVRLEQSQLDPGLTRTNRRTAELLKMNDIHAEFDLPDVETHAKAVLIDGRILYVGNHNWSESALERNKEVSVRVESEKPLSVMRRYFERFDKSMRTARMSG